MHTAAFLMELQGSELHLNEVEFDLLHGLFGDFLPEGISVQGAVEACTSNLDECKVFIDECLPKGEYKRYAEALAFAYLYNLEEVKEQVRVDILIGVYAHVARQRRKRSLH